ncbi:MAG: beta-lactamase family protein [Thermoplasmatales archaeon]|nr:MAG: beta-lactamase family protein [Thermoplasmatales archaeon]
MTKEIVRKGIAIGIIVFLVSVTVPIQIESIIIASTTEELLTADDRFDNLIESMMSLAHMPALSTAIIKDNELVLAKGYGLYDRENNKEANGETIYLVASISKTFTATAIIQLYEKGYFDLDDDVNNYLSFDLRNPKYPDKNITFRMLLAHQSSLATDLPTFFMAVPGELAINGYPHPFLQELLGPGGIHYRPQLWNNYPPGEDMYYANIGFAVLGYLVEILSGQTLEEYCRENIFEPLGMNETSFQFSNVNISKVAVPYKYLRKEYYPFIHYNVINCPAGGLRTSVVDLSHFLIAHMNDGVYDDTQILSPESVEEMHTVQYQSDTYLFQYGLGFQIWTTLTDTYIGHSGGLYGVATKMVFRESDNIGIIMFFNKAVAKKIDRIVFSMIELLLFLKGNGFSTSRIGPREVFEVMQSNKFLSLDYYIDNQRINTLIDLRGT